MSGKLRILHFIDSLGSGGAERLLYTNLKHLDGERFEHEVVTVFDRPDFWKESIQELGIEVKSLGLTSRRGFPVGVRRFTEMMRASRPDVIHVHLWTASVIGRIAARRLKVPVISSVHSLDHEPEAFRGAARAVRIKLAGTRALDRWTARLGEQRFVAVSRRVKESIRRRMKIADEKIAVIYNPILRTEASETSSKIDLRNEIGADASSRVMLMVGRVSREKGILEAIDALAQLRQDSDDVHLVVIGAHDDSRYLQQVKELASQRNLADRVHLIGERMNVFDYLRECDVFVFPSHFEGLGIALAEAMAAGCACVASDIAPINEFVTHGENGMLTAPNDPEQLAAAVETLLEDSELRTRLGSNAQIRANEMFDPSKAANELAELYLAVAGA